MILVHGTTRRRAERIHDLGPGPRYREPGGLATADGFSLCLESGPFPFGTPEEYARGKSGEFPGEGGPVIVILDVPDEVAERAATEWFPLSQGLVQFDPRSGPEELLAVWSQVATTAQIRSVE